MVFEEEITTDFIEAMEKRMIDFPYSAVAQFFPMSDHEFKFVVIKYEFECWEDYNEVVDIHERTLFWHWGYDDNDIYDLEYAKSKIVDHFYDVFDRRKSHMELPEKYSKYVFGFDEAIRQLEDWLKDKTGIPNYRDSSCGYDFTSGGIDDLFSIGKKYFRLHEQGVFDDRTELFENFRKLYKDYYDEELVLNEDSSKGSEVGDFLESDYTVPVSLFPIIDSEWMAGVNKERNS